MIRSICCGLALNLYLAVVVLAYATMINKASLRYLALCKLETIPKTLALILLLFPTFSLVLTYECSVKNKNPDV